MTDVVGARIPEQQEAGYAQRCLLVLRSARQQRVTETALYRALRTLPVVSDAMLRTFAADLRRLHDALSGTELAGHYWVWSGLLLGWAREGGLLERADVDGDFAVCSEDWAKLEAAIPAIVRAGFRRDRRCRNNAGEVTELTFLRHGARFEFFRFETAGTRYRHIFYGGGGSIATTARFVISGEQAVPARVEVEAQLPRQELVPFEFLGRRWLKVADHELELSQLYGDWRTPDPSWSYLEDTGGVVRRSEWTNNAEYDW